MTKKNVLLVSFIGMLLIFSQFLFDSNTCGGERLCNNIGDVLNQDNLTLIHILPLVFLFSIITYKMHNEVFKAWWAFARWFAPVIVVVTFIFNAAGSGGLIGMGKDFAFFILFVLYSIFVLVSSIKIIRTHRRLKY